MLVRVAYAFPSHRYPAEADCVGTGLVAFRILKGHPSVFYSGVRLGAFESYLHALVFLLFGPSNGSLAVAPLITGSVTLLFFYLWVRELFGHAVALPALLVLAIPSPSYIFWTYMPNGYAETLLFSSAALWLSARVGNGKESPAGSFALGAAIGLGFWNCFLSIAATGPALVWIALRRRRRMFSARFWVPVLAGAILGAAPWIAFNVRYHLASFREGYGARPASTLSDAAANAGHFFRYDVPELTIRADPEDAIDRSPSSFSRALAPCAGAVYGLAMIYGVFALWRRRSTGNDSRGEPSPLLVPMLVIGAVGVLNTFSAAGQMRNLTVRYVLPMFFGLAVLVGLLARRLRHRPWLAAAAIAAVLAFNVSSYFWPWTRPRRRWRQQQSDESRLVAFLETRAVAFVAGDYWAVYQINFLSRESVRAVPILPMQDLYRIGDSLPKAPSRFALVEQAPTGKMLARVPARAALSGETTSLSREISVFLPLPNPPPDQTPARLLSRIRAAAGAPDQTR